MIKKYLFLITLFGCFSFGFSQSIFSNTITGTNPGAQNPYTTGQIVDPNISVNGGISRGPGLITSPTTANRYNARNWATTVAIDLNDYFQFTLTPNPNFEIDFTNLVYTGQRSNPNGPTSIAVRSSLDGFSSNIFTTTLPLNNTPLQSTIDLSGPNYQNINASISFRIYAWNAGGANGNYSINSFTFNGNVVADTCASSATWDGSDWSNTTGPDININAVLNGDYDTSLHGSFSACSLTVNGGFGLDIQNGTFIEIQKNIVADGDITIFPEGSVVQVNGLASTTANGTVTVQKETTPINSPLKYTYWSSPVIGETVENVFNNVPASRRFVFNAANFEDLLAEVGNTGTYVDGQDDIDDDDNSWQLASGPMEIGVGYAATASPFIPIGFPEQFTFIGPFNNGIISVPIVNNSGDAYNDWNFIGNPYPSALSTADFFTTNAGIVDGAIYLWSQATAADANAQGNEGQNFSADDYAIISGSGINTAGGSGITPNNYVPSGQGFFVEALSSGNVTFNNAMRRTGNNDQFYRNDVLDRQVLWLNLTSDNGVFNQIAIAHIDGATDGNDGSYYDVKRNASSPIYAKLHSKIEGNDNEFVIQGKNPNSLTLNEIIPLGFSTSIDVSTIYTISIAQFEGAFYGNNVIYLKDNLLNTFHNLKTSDYNFTSEIGEFNDRFEIVFNADVLSTNDNDIKPSQLIISEHSNGNVRIALNHNKLTISNIEIIDITGRQIYNFKAKSASDIYDLSNLNKAAYIARVSLSNGQVISKKAIKQN